MKKHHLLTHFFDIVIEKRIDYFWQQIKFYLPNERIFLQNRSVEMCHIKHLNVFSDLHINNLHCIKHFLSDLLLRKIVVVWLIAHVLNSFEVFLLLRNHFCRLYFWSPPQLITEIVPAELSKLHFLLRVLFIFNEGRRNV